MFHHRVLSRDCRAFYRGHAHAHHMLPRVVHTLNLRLHLSRLDTEYPGSATLRYGVRKVVQRVLCSAQRIGQLDGRACGVDCPHER